MAVLLTLTSQCMQYSCILVDFAMYAILSDLVSPEMENLHTIE